jgi:hypothetical protein
MQTVLGCGLAALLLAATPLVPRPVPAVGTSEASKATLTRGQPPRRLRLLVVAPFDSANDAIADAIGAAVAADTAGRSIYVVSRKDQLETLQQAGFAPDIPLAEKDISAIGRLMRADYVIRVQLSNGGARVETSGGTPGSATTPMALRMLVRITASPRVNAGGVANVTVKSLRADTTYRRLREPVQGGNQTPAVR